MNNYTATVVLSEDIAINDRWILTLRSVIIIGIYIIIYSI